MNLYLYHVLVSYGTVGLLRYVDEGSILRHLTCTLALMDDVTNMIMLIVQHVHVDCTLTCTMYGPNFMHLQCSLSTDNFRF